MLSDPVSLFWEMVVMSGFTFLMIAFSLVCFIDVLVAMKALNRGGKRGIWMGCACIGAFLVTLSYTISLFVQDYFLYSVLSSIYFAGIDYTLFCLLFFNWYFINPSEDKKPDSLYRFVLYFTVLDELVLLINPFWEIAISYVRNSGEIACYGYQMHLLYYVHLFFDYFLILLVLYELVAKCIRAP